MSDTQELKDAVKEYRKTVDEKKAAIKRAAEEIQTVRQVKTELPNR